MEIGRDVEIGQDKVEARQVLIMLLRYVLDDGGHRGGVVDWLSRPRGGWAVIPTMKARYVIDVIVDAKSTTRRCYRSVRINKSKGHPEVFFHWPGRNRARVQVFARDI